MNNSRNYPAGNVSKIHYRKEFTFDSFPSAIAFAVRLAFESETVDHHPDIMIQYKRVQLTYSTHSAGGLTQKDIDGARIANQVVS